MTPSSSDQYRRDLVDGRGHDQHTEALLDDERWQAHGQDSASAPMSSARNSPRVRTVGTLPSITSFSSTTSPGEPIIRRRSISPMSSTLTTSASRPNS